MATRRPPGVASIKEKNRRNTERKARENGGTFTNKAGKEVGISKPHAANRNAGVLSRSGSPEAKELNASLPPQSQIQVHQEAPAAVGSSAANNPTAPTLANAQALELQQADTNAGLMDRFNAKVNQVADGFSNRMDNVADVLNIAADPFSDDRIQSNTGNDLVDSTLEAFANNPYKVALGATGGVMLAKSILGSASTVIPKLGQVASTPKTVAVANTKNVATTKSFIHKMLTSSSTRTVTTVNPVTGSASTKIVTSSGRLISPTMAVTATFAIMMASIGSAGATFHNRLESVGGMGALIHNALEHGNTDVALEAAESMSEMADMSNFDIFKAFIPAWGFTEQTLSVSLPAAKQQGEGYKEIINDADQSVRSGESDPEYWDRIYEKRAASEKQLEEQKFANEQTLIRLQEDARARGDETSYKYYVARIAEQAKFEAKKIKDLRAYWDWYFKTSAQMRNLNSPSSLTFGLL